MNNIAMKFTKPTNGMMELTRKQIQINLLISEGYSSDEIAAQLCISRQTVDSHRKTILKLSGCRTWNQYMADLGISGQLEHWRKSRELSNAMTSKE